MRILRVINTMNPSYGGPCQGIRNSIPEMKRVGVINDVVCLDDPNDNFIELDPFRVIALGKAKGPWAFNANLIPWLVENFKNYNVVIIHGVWLFHGYAVMKALKKYQKVNPVALPKVYLMPHGMLDPYFQRAKGRKLKAIRNFLYWNLIERKVVNEVDALLFTCEQEMKLANVSLTPYNPNNEINVGYGVQKPPEFDKSMVAEFEAKCIGLNSTPYILFLSRLHQKKGVDLLIQSYLNLKEKGLSLPQLVIAGPGLESTYGKLMQKMAIHDGDILFPGMLTGNAKWGAFYGCHSFILPSHQENFGISVIEALACGRPVLITDQVNIWREIKKYKAGVVCQDTIEGVEEALNNWINLNNEQRSQYNDNAIELYENVFTIKNSVSVMIEAIR